MNTPTQKATRSIIRQSLEKRADAHIWFLAARIQQYNIHKFFKEGSING